MRDEIPFVYEDLEIVENYVKYIDAFDSEMRQKSMKGKGKKDVVDNLLQKYISLYFVHPECEKLLKKNKGFMEKLESEENVCERKVRFGIFGSLENFDTVF